MIVAPCPWPASRPTTVSRIGGAIPARGMRAIADGEALELEQVEVQSAHRTPTP